MAVRELATDAEWFHPYIQVQFNRDETKRGIVTLTVKSNIGVSDEGPKGPGGKGGAPRELPEIGEAIMQALVRALGKRRWTAHRETPAELPPGEEPPHQGSSFNLTATLNVADKSDDVLIGVFKGAIADAKSDTALRTYGITSDAVAAKFP